MKKKIEFGSFYFIVSIFNLFFIGEAKAFPEVTRHGYTNCIACHISPSGGGVLTPYGQQLSKELLSAKFSNEASAQQGGSKEMRQAATEAETETWLLGGDLRFLYFHRKNEYENSVQLIPMQIQGELAFNSEHFAFAFRAGYVGRGSSSGGEGGEGGGGGGSGAFDIPTAYALVRVGETFNARAGKFLPAYGLNNSLHIMSTRGALGFGFGDQRTGLELSYIGENFAGFASSFGTRGNGLGKTADSIQIQYSPNEGSKFAINTWREKDLRDLYGIWFVSKIYGPSYIAADWNRQNESFTNTKGEFYFTKLGVEVHQGLHFYMLSDISQRDLERAYTRVTRLGPGVQYFPVPRCELEGVWLRERNLIYSAEEGDYAYILFHLYL